MKDEKGSFEAIKKKSSIMERAAFELSEKERG